MNNPMAVLVMGSKSDLEYAVELEEKISGFHVPVSRRIMSAHRNTADILKVVSECDKAYSPLVYVAYVGKKPDLGPVIAGNTDNPVVMFVKETDPRAFYPNHLLSALDSPSGISYAVFTDVTNTALYVARIFGITDSGVRAEASKYRTGKASSNLGADAKYSSTPLTDLTAKFAKKPG